MLTEPSALDEFLFLQFKSGNESAFEQLFKAHYNPIVGFCNQFISDHDKSASLAQEAFINLWMNRSKIQSPNGIKSFLYTFAKSSCLNFIRHQKVVSKYEDRHLQAMEGKLNSEVLDSFDFDALEFSEMEELIYRSISELPEKCRQVFMASRFEGKKNKEIADELQISVKSVEANITRALKTLSVKLGEYLPAVLVQMIMHYMS
ncbi:RNA polymerase sigma-70 factor [Mangrovibacterium lignilyticum]|uniref:RNA polymerase sigma-70 factor n=1 Tax=Mangrovibacterium lignilyticum TaxID=2668052 RepID=UPI0013D86289|nr:RNA polymerase sigma-70 factor [Mangrovibacterium lignilyticum]